MKKGNQGGGFNSFINSIISDRITLKSQYYSPARHPKNVTPAKTEDNAGDLALIQALNQSSTVAGPKADRNLPRGNVGLGYQQTKAEAEAVTQIQRLKNQIRNTAEAAAVIEDQKKLSKSDEGKHGAIGKKEERDDKTRMLSERKEKKRAKKERQKEKKDEEKKKVAQEVIVVKEQKRDEVNPPIEGERRRFKTKTRSRQKNKKRDNRPIEEKRLKLAEKGIII